MLDGALQVEKCEETRSAQTRSDLTDWKLGNAERRKKKRHRRYDSRGRNEDARRYFAGVQLTEGVESLEAGGIICQALQRSAVIRPIRQSENYCLIDKYQPIDRTTRMCIL